MIENDIFLDVGFRHLSEVPHRADMSVDRDKADLALGRVEVRI